MIQRIIYENKPTILGGPYLEKPPPYVSYSKGFCAHHYLEDSRVQAVLNAAVPAFMAHVLKRVCK